MPRTLSAVDDSALLNLRAVRYGVAGRRKRLVKLKAEISSVQRELKVAISNESRTVRSTTSVKRVACQNS